MTDVHELNRHAADVWGHFSIPCGLAVSARNTVTMLVAHGWATRLHTVSRGEEAIEPASPQASAVNIFHINPGEFTRLFAWRHEDPRFEKRLNVCVPFWELPQLPESWVPVIESMDLVLAPTTFVADAVRRSVPSAKVVLHPQGVDIPEGVRTDRARFDLSQDAFIFGTSFAAEAISERKNPHATISAFQQAFPDDPDVRLVVRASPGSAEGSEAVWRSLREFAGSDDRVIIHTERLAYVDVLSLYASFDVYVSLHRAEGLGLGMMEAMALGTPVIATGWSGNMDFMSAENSMLVGYDLVPVVVGPLNPYSAASIGEQAQWAEPRVGEAAERMREIRETPGMHGQLAQRAQADTLARLETIARAGFIDSLDEHLAHLSEDRSDHIDRAAALRRVERRGRLMRPYYAARRAAGVLRRALRRGR